MSVDPAIVARAQRGEPEALDSVLAELYPLVRKHVTLLLGRSAAADDAVQEAMIDIARSLRSYEGRSKLTTWALRIAQRKVCRHRGRLRRDPLHQTGEITDLPFELSSPDRELLIILMQALDRIPPKQAEAFVLTEVLGFTTDEAARILGAFANTVASRKRHAREALIRHLTDPTKKETGPLTNLWSATPQRER